MRAVELEENQETPEAVGASTSPTTGSPPRRLSWALAALFLLALVFGAVGFTGGLAPNLISVPILFLMLRKLWMTAAAASRLSESIATDDAALQKLEWDRPRARTLARRWAELAHDDRIESVEDGLEGESSPPLIMGASRAVAAAADVNVAIAANGTIAMTLDQLYGRHLSREHPALDEVGVALASQDQRRMVFLSTAYDYFFGLGFAGSLFGIIIQAYIAQAAGGGVFSRGFLAGTLLAVTTTLQGVLSAFYVRSRHARLGEGLDGIRERAMALARLYLLPALTGLPPEEAAAAAAVRVMQRQFKDLQDTIRDAINGLPRLVADATATAAQQAVGTLSAAIITPTQQTLLSYKGLVDTCRESLEGVIQRFEASAKGVESAARVPAGLVAELRDAQRQVKNAADGLGDVAVRCREVADAVRDAASVLQAAAGNLPAFGGGQPGRPEVEDP